VRLRVTGGWLVTPRGRLQADLVADDGVITALTEPGRAGTADEELDASGLWIFPGFIDPHVHSRDPGQVEKEGFAHATLAALCGGITTIFDMPNTVPPLSRADQVRGRAAAHEPAWCDFGLWGIGLGAENLAEIPGLLVAGVVGIKLYWAYALDRRTEALVQEPDDPSSVVPPPTTDQVMDLFRCVAACGGLVAVHCEDRGILDSAARQLPPPRDGEGLAARRPAVAETAAVALAAEIALETGCRLHVVHVSSARAADLVRRARADGMRISAETCPHYLVWTAADARDARFKVFPPLRSAADRDALWAALRDGTIASLGSDHAPHTAEEKALDLAGAPAGLLGAETMATVMLGEMTRGRLEPERLASLLATGTARIFGLYPRKGALWPGSDCDLTVVDPEAPWRIDQSRLHSKNPVSAWDGWSGRGRPRYAVLRGQLAMCEGEPVGEPGGRLVTPAMGAARAPGEDG
jgi:allantoinase